MHQNNSNVPSTPRYVPLGSKTLFPPSYHVLAKRKYTTHPPSEPRTLNFSERSVQSRVAVTPVVVLKKRFERQKMHLKNTVHGCLIECGVGSYKKWKKGVRWKMIQLRIVGENNMVEKRNGRKSGKHKRIFNFVNRKRNKNGRLSGSRRLLRMKPILMRNLILRRMIFLLKFSS